MFYQVPYGAWTFSTYAAASQSQSILTPSVTRYAYRSQSKAAGIKADRVFSRSQKHITSAYAGIDYVKQTAKFADSKLELQSPEIYSAQVGLSHTAILPNGIWLNNIGVEQGFAKNTEHNAVRQALYLCILAKQFDSKPSIGQMDRAQPSSNRCPI